MSAKSTVCKISSLRRNLPCRHPFAVFIFALADWGLEAEYDRQNTELDDKLRLFLFISILISFIGLTCLIVGLILHILPLWIIGIIVSAVGLIPTTSFICPFIWIKCDQFWTLKDRNYREQLLIRFFILLSVCGLICLTVGLVRHILPLWIVGIVVTTIGVVPLLSLAVLCGCYSCGYCIDNRR